MPRARVRGRSRWAELWKYRYLYLMLMVPLAFVTYVRFYPILGNVIACKN